MSTVEIPFSHLLTDSQKERIEENMNLVRFRKKDIIFRQNTRISDLIFIKSGLVKIFKDTRNEKTVILKVAAPGEFVGLISVFGKNVHQYSAAAIEDSEVFDIDFNFFKSILAENGRYALQIINLLSLDGLFIFERLMGQSHKQLPGRIADVILYFSQDVFRNDVFYFPFTRKELADLAGTTKESFIRTLTEFKNDKIIDIQGSKIIIRSMDIIKTLSELG